MLRPWQVEPANRLTSILRTHDSAVDCSDTGTGKTFVAVAVAAALRLPTLMVVPKISITAWSRVAEMFGEEFSIVGYEKLRTGRTDFGSWEHQAKLDHERTLTWRCECCQQVVNFDNPTPCYTNFLGIHCIAGKKTPLRYGQFIFNPAVKVVCFDECHRCGGIDSLNAEMMIATKRQRIKMLGLSATLACDPMKLRALGYSLDLHGDRYDHPYKTGYYPMTPNFYRWAASHGCRKISPLPGIRWAVGAEKQKAIMAGIRAQIIPERGVRVTTAEIPGFPERIIEPNIYDLEQDGQIDRCYKEMEGALNALAHAASQDKAPDHPLTVLLRARQKVEILKVPVVVELVQDYLEKGLSVAVFVNFKATMDELRRRLNCKCFIDGSPGGCLNRQQSIDEFQSNQSRLILANSEAGGISVSLHDIHGGHPRVGLVMPTFSAVTFRQVVGRLHRDGSQSPAFYKVVFAAKTVEEKIARALKQKLSNLDALLDGDLMP